MLILFLAPSEARAQVPQTLSYQGVLTNANGNVVADGDYTLTVTLYDAATDGTALWTETQTTTVAGGIFSVILGSSTALELPFDQPYWLGVALGQDPELTPRLALTAAPYSLSARAIVAEPEAGESFAVRDADGAAAHLLSPDGNTVHTGTGTFEGGVVVPEPDSTTGGKRSDETVGVSAWGRRIGVAGMSVSGDGVVGITTSGRGIYSVSVSGDGIFGSSTAGVGIRGTSRDNIGILGEGKRGVQGNSDDPISAGVHGSNSGSGKGVFGFSQEGIGGQFLSITGTGLHATGHPAGTFFGDVEIRTSSIEDPPRLLIDLVEEDPDQERVLVWSDDAYVRYRTLADLGGGDSGWLVDANANEVSTPHSVVIKDATGQVTTRFDPDGTSLHTGDETFTGDVILEGPGIKLVDEQGETLAGFGRMDLDTGQRLGVFARAEGPNDLAGAFQGDVDVLDGALRLFDVEGNLLTSFNKDGTSFHGGKETFAGGLEVINSDGSVAMDVAPDASPTTGYAVTVNGNVMIDGILQAQTKQFKIDHPLDPENKYLHHTSVESDAMLNLYNGNVVLGAEGGAWVALPAWFEALNGEFRYQLTPIGAPGPGLYVAEEIQGNRFKIAGGAPGMKVSWQVTGIRHDPWAQANRAPVVTDKPLRGGEQPHR